jgi:hypothetical protein
VTAADDALAGLGRQRLASEVARHRHRWVTSAGGNDGDIPGLPSVSTHCAYCPAVKDEARSRAGRNSRARGNRRELEVARALGGEKVGQFGGPEDVRLPLLNIQSKVRRAFPYWMTDELAKLPRTVGRLPALVVTDSPGPGTRRRSIVVLALEDFVELHGRIA